MGRGFILIAVLLSLCVPQTRAAPPRLSVGDVQQILTQAIARAKQVSPDSVIAVTDREGYVLAMWAVGKQPTIGVIAGAASRAGTAAFLSSDQNAFTSRTAGYIIQQHFPPMVRDTPPGPLVGVGLSSIYVFPDAAVSAIVGGASKKLVLFGVHSDVNFIKQIPTDATGFFDPNFYFA